MQAQQRRFIPASMWLITLCGIYAHSRRRHVVQSLGFLTELHRTQGHLPLISSIGFKSNKGASHSVRKSLSRTTYWLTMQALSTLTLSFINMALGLMTARYRRTYISLKLDPNK
ncbi:hypothetical protein TNCT_12101 [Trichonephila clavata]|uniref:Uncharacterized protein n=1 Tax=Trichonephila clavata TaxID=2740835 RepID=A0A8X6H5T3_TRICU|nr:hypothetical protein TNCT_12101 [Trichonephila clavata]